MAIDISNGRKFELLHVDPGNSIPQFGVLCMSSRWPGVSVDIHQLNASDLRTIAAECTRVAGLLDPDVITSTKAA